MKLDANKPFSVSRRQRRLSRDVSSVTDGRQDFHRFSASTPSKNRNGGGIADVRGSICGAATEAYYPKKGIRNARR
jgi:hypothetical protein